MLLTIAITLSLVVAVLAMWLLYRRSDPEKRWKLQLGGLSLAGVVAVVFVVQSPNLSLLNKIALAALLVSMWFLAWKHRQDKSLDVRALVLVSYAAIIGLLVFRR